MVPAHFYMAGSDVTKQFRFARCSDQASGGSRVRTVALCQTFRGQPDAAGNRLSQASHRHQGASHGTTLTEFAFAKPSSRTASRRLLPQNPQTTHVGGFNGEFETRTN